ncbi:MMPL family transporter [Demequina sp. NBRC 110055]|uniref:MMPL family transporter n=1 Tax=Demequina sp. NBRC 110055 TaxID=1570344 RepID=UPI0009FE7773|nr:MMPL family transporter [Demequina sp. NBRC 110055]
MSPQGITGRLARTAASRPWLTVSVWFVALVAAGYAASGLGDALTQDDRIQVATESDSATALVAAHNEATADAVGASDATVETVVVASDNERFGSPAFAEALATLVRALDAVDGVATVTAPTADAAGPAAADGSSALITASVTADEDGEVVDSMLAALEDATPAGFEVSVAGEATGSAMFDSLAEEGLVRGEAIGIAVALVILVGVFGALLAAGIPLVVAIAAIVMAVGATAVVGQAFELSFFVVNMITMMGLALGIDYSLVMVQRFREELASGRSVLDAVTVAGGTANRAVLFSGITVVISLLGLLLVPSTIMRSLGAGAILVAVMAVAASLTLLPAILRLLGQRVNAGRLPARHPDAEPRAWRAIARTVSARPGAWAMGGLVILGLLAAPATQMRMAFPGLDALPEDNSLRVAAETLAEDYGLGQGATVIAVEGGASARVAVEEIASRVSADPAFADAAVTYVGDDAIVTSTELLDAADPEADAAIARLRDDVVPAALEGTEATAYVGGDQAEAVDFTGIIRDATPWVLLTVLGASFVLLLVAFRSVVVPTMAIALNLLSTAAAFGMLVAVFQWGWGGTLLGFPQVDGIAPWIPLFLFAVLFGLSMDYHVFLLSRIKERHDAGAPTREAVAYGLSRTGSLITGAALIMVAVFAGFALGDLAEFSQMGFGLAAAVILDATVVRSILVPALMTLLGRRNWYLPGWLEWLPQVTIEAEPAAASAVRPRDEREPALV